MKETFLELCELHEWVAFVMWAGPQSKAEDACKQIDEIAKEHPILNFFAMILHPYFGYPLRRKL